MTPDRQKQTDLRAPAARPRSRLKRWVLSALLLLLTIVSFPILKEYYARWHARKELAEVISEVDRLDPRWRLEDIEADRRQIAPGQNAAAVALAASRLLPRDWQPSFSTELDKVPPHMALAQELAKKLAAELETRHAALKKARQLKDLAWGRHTIQYTDDYISTMFKDQQDVRPVAALLEFDIALLLHQRQLADALNSHRALLNASRSIGDEPTLISCLIRMALDKKAVVSLERILAQEEPAQPALEETQKALQEEIDTPLFVIGLRGDRAGWHRFMSNIETGKMTMGQAFAGRRPRKTGEDQRWWAPLNDFLAFSMVLRSHAAVVRFETRAIEAAKLPPESRYDAVGRIYASFNTEFPEDDRSLAIGRLMMPAFIKLATAEQRNHTRLACAVAGLGVEQFRRQLHRWPASLDEVAKAGFLKEVPLDLFDGQPLRFRPTRDGVIVFSIGETGAYDGSARDNHARAGLDQAPPGEGEPVEFRLWDVGQRRTPPLEAQPAD
jgi:hypothetical protein